MLTTALQVLRWGERPRHQTAGEIRARLSKAALSTREAFPELGGTGCARRCMCAAIFGVAFEVDATKPPRDALTHLAVIRDLSGDCRARPAAG